VPYVALEWDHKIVQPMISWVVVECSGVGEKCGGPVALAPRRDIAYFLDEKTGERDAKGFAEYKNAQQEGRLAEQPTTGELQYHAPYSWDHLIHSDTLRWGVLEWNGKHGKPGPRTDVGYFLDVETAESDARWFCRQRDRWIIDGAGEHPPALTLARKVG
jgi:hypothetical protein